MTDEGEVLAVTGEEGAIFRVHDRGDATLVLDAEEDLVVAVVKDGDAFVAATANPARLLRLEDSPGSEGTYRSEVLDARYVSPLGPSGVGRGRRRLGAGVRPARQHRRARRHLVGLAGSWTGTEPSAVSGRGRSSGAWI